MHTPENTCPSEIIYKNHKEAFFVNQYGLVPLSEITDNDFQNQPVFIMFDHNEAGKVWDRAYQFGLLNCNSHLTHVDAHDDLSLRKPLPTSYEELVDREYQAGSFILPRVNIGMIGKITWVKPLNHSLPTTQVTQSPGSSVLSYPYSICANDLRNKPTISETSEIPYMDSDLLDIDLDFFTHGLSPHMPDCILKRRVSNFMNKLLERIWGIKIITIAISPGYIQTNREKILLESVLNKLI